MFKSHRCVSRDKGYRKGIQRRIPEYLVRISRALREWMNVAVVPVIHRICVEVGIRSRIFIGVSLCNPHVSAPLANDQSTVWVEDLLDPAPAPFYPGYSRFT